MQGQYKGFSTFLSEQDPNQIHVWCFLGIINAMLLNLKYYLEDFLKGW